MKFLAMIVGTVLLGMVLSSALILFQQDQQLIESTRTSSQRVGTAIQASLEHAMLTNDHTMLDQMLTTVAREAGLGRVRIVGTDGQVWISSVPNQAGMRISENDPLCLTCHGNTTSAVISSSQAYGENLINASVIENKPACYACHGTGKRTLGLLLFETPQAALLPQLLSSFWRIVFASFIIALLLIGLLTPALWKLVIRPVVQLARGAQEIGAGNLDYESQVDASGEVGELARTFDTMRQQLKVALEDKERRNRDLHLLNEISRATSELLDPQQILDLTIHFAVSSLGVQSGAIYLLDPDGGRFSLHACEGMTECREIACQLWGFNRVLAGLTRPDNPAVSVPAVAETCFGMSQDAQGRSYLGVPLKSKGMTIGAMTLVTHPGQDVTGEGAKTLKAMGEQIGLALANAIHFQNVRNQATLNERERLAREMHDSLAQALSYIKLQTSLTDDLLSKGQIIKAQSNLRDVKEVAKETYTNVREQIFGLRHLAHSRSEFWPTLEEYLVEYRTHYGLYVQLVAADNCRPCFPAEVSLQLTRIVQEALTNIRKHAATKQATLHFARHDHHWCITIEDHGRGFDPERIPQSGEHHVGLQIMRERAASIGATFELRSRPGGGATIIICVPGSREQENVAALAYSSSR